MRQFFTLRFWMTVVALGALAIGVAVIAKRNEAKPDAASADLAGDSSARTIDVVAWVYAVQPSPEFAMVDGRANKDLALVIDGTRTMIVKAGTPGEIDCPRLAELAQCTVAADLLGDGVLWFSIVRGAPGASVELPAVAELLDGGWVRLENGWVVQHAPKVERNCAEDTASLRDFIDVFGASARSTFNFERQQIVKVTCPKVTGVTTTVSSTTIDPTITTLGPITIDTGEAG